MLTTLFTIFITSFIIALSGAMMPGPLLTAVIGESTQRGFIAGPLMIGGHAMLELVLVALLLMGLAPFLRLPPVFIVIAFSGAAILLWLAYGMFRSLPSLSLYRGCDTVGGGHRKHPVISGFLMSLANPYWIIWWATIGMGYIVYSWKFGLRGVACFFAGHILADLAWYSFISAAVACGRRFISDRIYRGIIAVCAALLVAFAGYFAYSGISSLTVLRTTG